MNARESHQVRAVADPKLTVLVGSVPGAAAVARALPDGDSHSHIRVLNRCGNAAANASNLLVFSAASKLDQVAECVSVANKSHRLAALLVYNDVATDWLPYVFYHSGLRTLRNMIVHSDPETPTRILNAWAMGAEHDFIADAAVINSRLIVRSCAFEEYSLAFNAFPALEGIPESARSNFDLEDEGLLLHWPEFDVHLDLEDIRFANDPKRQQAARTARIGDQRAIGMALRQLREEAGLKQTDVKDISERQVRRVESGDRLTVDALDAFALALGVDADVLLERLSELVDEQASAGNESRQKARPSASTPIDAQLLVYPHPTGRKQSQHTPRIAESLRLAANSSEDATAKRWTLFTDANGSIDGRLDHDFRKDELAFVIDRVRNIEQSALQIVVIAWTSQLAAPLVSKPVTPSTDTRVVISSGRGLVPRDVSRLEIKTVNEH
jgi:transcriptional regulator with XRE-family HTH domain